MNVPATGMFFFFFFLLPTRLASQQGCSRCLKRLLSVRLGASGGQVTESTLQGNPQTGDQVQSCRNTHKNSQNHFNWMTQQLKDNITILGCFFLLFFFFVIIFLSLFLLERPTQYLVFMETHARLGLREICLNLSSWIISYSFWIGSVRVSKIFSVF